MYQLIAEYGRAQFGVELREAVVARFSTREAALEYIKAARLKNGAPRIGESPFRKGSLLDGASVAWAMPEEHTEVPVDPVFKG